MPVTTRSKSKVAKQAEVVRRKEEYVYGYKGFRKAGDGTLWCRNFCFGKPTRGDVCIDPETHNMPVSVCRRGFHFCRYPNDVITYYHTLPQNVYRLIRAKKRKVLDEADKSATSEIQFIDDKNLSFDDIKDHKGLYVVTDAAGNDITINIDTLQFVNGVVNSGDAVIMTRVQAASICGYDFLSDVPFHQIRFKMEMAENSSSTPLVIRVRVSVIEAGCNEGGIDLVMSMESFIQRLSDLKTIKIPTSWIKIFVAYKSFAVDDGFSSAFYKLTGCKPTITGWDDSRYHIEIICEPKCMTIARQEMERLDELAEQEQTDSDQSH